MAERAFALEARAAFDADANDRPRLRHRRREIRARRAVDRDDMRADRGRDVHQSRVVRDRSGRRGKHIDRLLEARLPAQIADAPALVSVLDRSTELALLLRAEHPNRSEEHTSELQ